VERLLEAGRTVRVVSRRPRPAGGAAADREWATADLLTGDGVAGASALVHCATAFGRGKESAVLRSPAGVTGLW
jgi:nucleoside-diphosphate-sugar epimerase